MILAKFGKTPSSTIESSYLFILSAKSFEYYKSLTSDGFGGPGRD